MEAIPGYKIREKLGTGGMATVFLAEDTIYNRLVALKILNPKIALDKNALDKFLREAKLLVEFDHPNIVKGYHSDFVNPVRKDLSLDPAPKGAGLSNGVNNLYFLAMEYIDGVSVQDLIDQKGCLSEQESLEITLQLAKALEYMQGKGIIHRDIKPNNVLITKDNVVKLCDLGFAQPIGQGIGTSETTDGTVQYMSPEQAMGQRDLDIRSDIYSLGASLYHMIMGKVPFAGTDSLDVMAKQVLESLNSAEVKNKGISPLALYFIERMMAKEKDLRYANPTELIEDINTHIEGFKSLEY